MSKNISISESGIAKTFTVKKIKTNLVGGETTLWVNESEAGGQNLLLKSATKHLSAYSGSQITFVDGVTVSEWGATDAIRAYGSSGTSTIFGLLSGSVYNTTINEQPYVYSIYVKNNSTGAIRLRGNNITDTVTVGVGESKHIALLGIGNGTAYIQYNFYVQSAGNSFDITYWHPKIEEVAVWAPAPEDS